MVLEGVLLDVTKLLILLVGVLLGVLLGVFEGLGV